MRVYCNASMNLEVFPLEISRWKDFEALFGEKGACGGCWCMAWRLKKSDFEKQKGTENKSAMKKLVETNKPVGILAYIDGNPIGWCSVAPREDFVRLEKSRVWQRIDDKPVWSVTCIYIAKPYRRKGISIELLKAAINYCKMNDIQIIEGYPILPYNDSVPAAFAWTGIPSAFEKAGFVVAAKRSKSKPLMRHYI